MPPSPGSLPVVSGGSVEDALDLATVDVEFAGDGALAEARLVTRADRLLQRWRSRELQWCFVRQRRNRLMLRLVLSLTCSRPSPGAYQHH